MVLQSHLRAVSSGYGVHCEEGPECISDERLQGWERARRSKGAPGVTQGERQRTTRRAGPGPQAQDPAGSFRPSVLSAPAPCVRARSWARSPGRAPRCSRKLAVAGRRAPAFLGRSGYLRDARPPPAGGAAPPTPWSQAPGSEVSPAKRVGPWAGAAGEGAASVEPEEAPRGCLLLRLSPRRGASSSPAPPPQGSFLSSRPQQKPWAPGCGGLRSGGPGPRWRLGASGTPSLGLGAEGWGLRGELPRETVNPVRPEPALGNLCECGPRFARLYPGSDPARRGEGPGRSRRQRGVPGAVGGGQCSGGSRPPEARAARLPAPAQVSFGPTFACPRLKVSLPVHQFAKSLLPSASFPRLPPPRAVGLPWGGCCWIPEGPHLKSSCCEIASKVKEPCVLSRHVNIFLAVFYILGVLSSIPLL